MTRTEVRDRAAALLRDIPDFPEPGVTFKDITPLLADAGALAAVVEALADPWRGQVDVVAGLEARGFILAPAVALSLGVGFIPVRKAGKLPWETVGVDYDLEYGSARVEVHRDAATSGERVLIIDDVLATGGTAAAASTLVESLGASVAGIGVLIELAALPGRDALSGRSVDALVTV